jgi:hypothetical protein
VGPGHETTARGPACEPSMESRVGPGGSSRGWTRAIRLRRGLFSNAEGFSADEGGGDEETRTPDPLLAKEMLCQLSYVPRFRSAKWWAHLDSNQGPRPYQGRALTS